MNVLGDSYGAAIVGHLSRKELAEDKHSRVAEDIPIDDSYELRENGKLDGKGIETGDTVA